MPGNSSAPPGQSTRRGSALTDLPLQISDIARTLQTRDTKAEVLSDVAVSAVSLIAAADYAAVTLISKRGVSSAPVRPDPVVAELDRFQFACGQGPSLSAVSEHALIRADDLTIETRWPRFSAQAAQAGIRSILAAELFVQDETVGTLNLYARQPNVFDPGVDGVLAALAAHAALALVWADRRANFATALLTRDVIGQAKGVLMERHRIGEDAAFQLLLHASQSNNRKLSAVARMVAFTGQELTEENIRDF